MTELDTTPPTDDHPTADAPTPTRDSSPAAPSRAEPTPRSRGPPRPDADGRARARGRRPSAEPAPDADAEADARPPSREPPRPTPQPTSRAEPPRPTPSRWPTPDRGRSGRFIADSLRAAGVRYAFTVPGESFLGLLDAFEGAGIRVIATRHEGGAAFMAEAHGQLTGRPAVCLGTRAVGGTNLGIGIHTARQDSTPMFVGGRPGRAQVAGPRGVPGDRPGRRPSAASRSGPPNRTTAAEVATAMAEATRQALGGRPGPAYLSLPEDLLDEPMPDDVKADTARPGQSRATDDEIRAVIELLASARRPVILAGAGVLRARTSTELTRFAELLQVPVIGAWRRADVISNDHPLYLGMSGFGAASSVKERLDAADALLVIGSRLNEATSYGYTMPRPGLRWAHVDLAPGALVGSTAPEIAVAADAKAFLKAANERLVGRAVLDAALVAERQTANREDRAAYEAASVVDAQPWDGPGVHPGRSIMTLRRVLPDDAILTSDAGNFATWLGRGFRFRRPGTFLGPTSGAMGYGLPAAIAAALVHRDRPVVAVCGDGGLAMTMSELETAVRVGARVIVVVFDNERYGTIRMWQEERERGIGVATELGPVDFAAIARACGARGVRVDRDADFEPALRAALVADRATVIQLALDRAWHSIDLPPG